VRRARREPPALVVRTADGVEHRTRLGRSGLALLAAGLLALAGGLLAGAAALPSAISGLRARQEMDIALRRRAQLGDRLRAQVGELARLDRQVRELAARVERVRELYGLPELAVRPSPGSAGAVAESIFASAILRGAALSATAETQLSRTDALLASLFQWETAHRAEALAIPARLPVRAAEIVLVRAFGPGLDPLSGASEFHAGLDLAAPLGASVAAPAAGIVKWAGEAPASSGEAWWRLGRIVVLAHGERYRTLVGHCEQVLVRVGQRVAAGAPIALVGTSGWTPAPRLHYEVRRRAESGEWEAIDPRAVLLSDPFGALSRSEPEARRPSEGRLLPRLPRELAR